MGISDGIKLVHQNKTAEVDTKTLKVLEKIQYIQKQNNNKWELTPRGKAFLKKLNDLELRKKLDDLELRKKLIVARL